MEDLLHLVRRHQPRERLEQARPLVHEENKATLVVGNDLRNRGRLQRKNKPVNIRIERNAHYLLSMMMHWKKFFQTFWFYCR